MTTDGPPPGSYEVDSRRSRIEFSTRHLLFSTVRGRFTSFAGRVDVAEVAERSHTEVAIDASSVTTGDRTRDASLRGPDILDVARHPVITFTSTGLTEQRGDRFRMLGDLMLKGVPRVVALDVRYRGLTDDAIHFSAATVIERDRWGLSWGALVEAGGVMVGKTFRIDLLVVAVPV